MGRSGAPGSGFDWSPRPVERVTASGLRVLLKIDALRARVDLQDLPDGRLRLSIGDVHEDMDLGAACYFVALQLGTGGNVHVIANGLHWAKGQR